MPVAVGGPRAVAVAMVFAVFAVVVIGVCALAVIVAAVLVVQVPEDSVEDFASLDELLWATVLHRDLLAFLDAFVNVEGKPEALGTSLRVAARELVEALQIFERRDAILRTDAGPSRNKP